jgi:D-alanine--D-alanine ligase
MLKVALLLGGPSPERAISLNSARSVADHLEGDGLQIDPIVYFDRRCAAHHISRTSLYSNTPDDFDFKLSQLAKPLSPAELGILLQDADIAFPVMHGSFGEDGTVQGLLEEMGVPYVGSGSAECRTAYDKFLAHGALLASGIPSVPTVLYSTEGEPAVGDEALAAVLGWSKLVIKPSRGGSSLGITVIDQDGPDGAAKTIDRIRESARDHGSIVAQPFIDGTEFTTIVLERPSGPVALMPVEVELRHRGPEDIFSYRHKYLASDDARYHCPPRVPERTIRGIRRMAEASFATLGLRDFSRIDSWLSPDGQLLISDINPISGMEQNSFLFIQAAEAGMDHADVLRLVLSTACQRWEVPLPTSHWRASRDRPGRQRVPILFGGQTAERQVSVLSGTNVWLKLARSPRYEPAPYLLEDDATVWELPYAFALRHSVEQISELCQSAADLQPLRARLAQEVLSELKLEDWQRSLSITVPRRLSFDEFLSGQSFVFIALHGGPGEDGTLQQQLTDRNISYNGSGPQASKLCMDKYETGRRLAGYADDGIHVTDKLKVSLDEAFADSADAIWGRAVRACGTPTLVVKPLSDGCSTGVVPLTGPRELAVYLDAMRSGQARLDGAAFSLLGEGQLVDLPSGVSCWLIEAFVETDDIRVVTGHPSEASAAEARTGAGSSWPGTTEPSSLRWGVDRDTGWIEVTVGLLGPEGEMRALAPSLTVVNRGVLSVEEKFMGGTGVNITPPPAPPIGLVEPQAVVKTRELVARVARLLGLRGYGRIDAFMNRESGEIIVIEANSLPALSPATVLYQQALEEPEPLYPRDLLEHIIDLGRSVESYDHLGAGPRGLVAPSA